VVDGPWSEEKLQSAILNGLKNNQPAKALAAELAKQSGWPRREIYNLIVNRKS
jgi:hypothetical protein